MNKILYQKIDIFMLRVILIIDTEYFIFISHHIKNAANSYM